jgi:hypothetical protein
MKNWTCLGILAAILMVALTLCLAQRAWADAAPEPGAAASDIAPGQGTQVQMISETVVLDVRAEPMMSGDDAFTRTAVLVVADFLMRNLGNVTETMNVRFPMQWPTREGWAPLDTIQDMRTFVDGKGISNTHTSFDGQPWAVWLVTFPPGRDVRMRVEYRTTGQEWGNSLIGFFSSVHLMGDNSLADFYYILETGAGWRGPIGQGDIIFRFPYPASLEMIERGDTYTVYTSTTPAFVAEGRQLRWHFTNLEPTSKDNVRLSVITPPVWQAILDARRQAQSKPDDPQAQVQLGEAYWAAVPVKNTWPDELSLANHFGPLAEAAFKRAVELAPNNIKTQLAYARFLTYRAWGQTPEPYYSRARQEVRRVLELDPTNKDAQELVEFLDNTISLNLVTPTTTSTPQPTASVTVAPSPMPTSTATVTPQPTAAPAPTTTVTPAPAAALPSTARYGLCGGAAAIVVTLLVVTRRRPATRRE